MMDSKAELEVVSDRLKSSLKRKGLVEEEILAKTDFTVQEAVDFGFKYVFFTHEYFFAMVDNDAIGVVNLAEATNERSEKWESTVDFEHTVEATGLALRGAMVGDYRELKKFLAKRENGAKQGDPLSQKIMDMVAIMPDQGEPLSPPIPSTMLDGEQ